MSFMHYEGFFFFHGSPFFLTAFKRYCWTPANIYSKLPESWWNTFFFMMKFFFFKVTEGDCENPLAHPFVKVRVDLRWVFEFFFFLFFLFFYDLIDISDVDLIAKVHPVCAVIFYANCENVCFWGIEMAQDVFCLKN